jgi:hypothetical protein
MKKQAESQPQKHPQWVLKHKKPGTEIRLINGHYYVYAISSRWDSERKRPVKKTLGILGKITQTGFVESDKHRLKTKSLVIKQVWQLEYGFTHFLQSCLQDTVIKLQQYFSDSWQTIVAMSFWEFCISVTPEKYGFPLPSQLPFRNVSRSKFG